MKPLMLVSLPNSGSTWLADLIAGNTRYNRYFMEYFNPIRNAQHYETLAPHFGCELISCYRNIARGGYIGIDRAITSTWGSEDYNFTKEVFSPFKLPILTRHFRCFVLIRDAGDTFPPTRARVWSFYEHAWHALAEAGYRMAGNTCELRAWNAHSIMRMVLERDAAELGVPVIQYRELFTDKGLAEKLQAALGESGARLQLAIRASRVLSERQRQVV